MQIQTQPQLFITLHLQDSRLRRRSLFHVVISNSLPHQRLQCFTVICCPLAVYTNPWGNLWNSTLYESPVVFLIFSFGCRYVCENIKAESAKPPFCVPYHEKIFDSIDVSNDWCMRFHLKTTGHWFVINIAKRFHKYKVSKNYTINLVLISRGNQLSHVYFALLWSVKFLCRTQSWRLTQKFTTVSLLANHESYIFDVSIYRLYIISA